MWQSKRQPRIKKTCDYCNQSAFGLMRRHSGGKTFCSPHCEASFTNCRMIEGAEIEGPVPDGPHGDFIAAVRYPVNRTLVGLPFVPASRLLPL